MIRLFGVMCVCAWLPIAGVCDASSADLAVQVQQALRQLEGNRERALSECPPDLRRKVADDFDRVQRQLRVLEKGVRSRGGLYNEFLRDVRVFLNSPAKTLLSEVERKQLDAVVAWMETQRSLPLEQQGKDVPQVVRHVFSRDEETGFGMLEPAKYLSALLRSGDVLVRRDNGLWSTWFANKSQTEKRFSHVGIVVRSRNGEFCVVHAGGDDLSGGGSRICPVALDEFLDESVEVAVYRLPNVGDRIAKAAKKRIGTPFDPAFDLKTKDRLYCTEMVRDCVNEAAGREVIGTSRKGDFEYVAVDDCYHNEMTKVWDCRDVKPVAETPARKQKCACGREHGGECPPDAAVTWQRFGASTNAPVRRTIRFVPKNRR